jgi:RimJ/RimL family protein N-acetyltransferase
MNGDERNVNEVSLIPLSSERHAEALRAVYRGAQDYWEMYNLPASPRKQAALDLKAAEDTPGRTMMGIVRVTADSEGAPMVEMIGVVDFRLHWPGEHLAYVGMIMVTEPFRRQGVGSQAWRLLEPWLAGDADIQTARCGVEQFNPGALRFFQSLGFHLTGEANRLRVGDKFVRLLYMEKELAGKEKIEG